jgi:hypothetical protein
VTILLKIGVLQNTQKGVILYSLLAHDVTTCHLGAILVDFIIIIVIIIIYSR